MSERHWKDAEGNTDWDAYAAEAMEEYEGDIWTCQSCGKYSEGPGWHIRNGVDCGEFM